MNEVMNYRELSRYLKMAEGTMRRWVSEGKIPSFKIGRNVRFAKKDIDVWLEKLRRGLRGRRTGNAEGNTAGGADLFSTAGTGGET